MPRRDVPQPLLADSVGELPLVGRVLVHNVVDQQLFAELVNTSPAPESSADSRAA